MLFTLLSQAFRNSHCSGTLRNDDFSVASPCRRGCLILALKSASSTEKCQVLKQNMSLASGTLALFGEGREVLGGKGWAVTCTTTGGQGPSFRRMAHTCMLCNIKSACIPFRLPTQPFRHVSRAGAHTTTLNVIASWVVGNQIETHRSHSRGVFRFGAEQCSV